MIDQNDIVPNRGHGQVSMGPNTDPPPNLSTSSPLRSVPHPLAHTPAAAAAEGPPAVALLPPPIKLEPFERPVGPEPARTTAIAPDSAAQPSSTSTPDTVLALAKPLASPTPPKPLSPFSPVAEAAAAASEADRQRLLTELGGSADPTGPGAGDAGASPLLASTLGDGSVAKLTFEAIRNALFDSDTDLSSVDSMSTTSDEEKRRRKKRDPSATPKSSKRKRPAESNVRNGARNSGKKRATVQHLGPSSSAPNGSKSSANARSDAKSTNSVANQLPSPSSAASKRPPSKKAKKGDDVLVPPTLFNPFRIALSSTIAESSYYSSSSLHSYSSASSAASGTAAASAISLASLGVWPPSTPAESEYYRLRNREIDEDLAAIREGCRVAAASGAEGEVAAVGESSGAGVAPEAQRASASGRVLRIISNPPSYTQFLSDSGRPDGRSSPLSRSADDEKHGQNEDFCAACLGKGRLLCCDSCPRVFHFYCVEDGFDEGVDVPATWECKNCVFTKKNGKTSSLKRTKPSAGTLPTIAFSKPSNTTSKSKKARLFDALMDTLDSMNPRTFQLPLEVWAPFENVVPHPLTGDYLDTREYEVTLGPPTAPRPLRSVKASYSSHLNGASKKVCTPIPKLLHSYIPPFPLKSVAPTAITGTVADWCGDPYVPMFQSEPSSRNGFLNAGTSSPLISGPSETPTIAPFNPFCYQCGKSGPRLDQTTLLNSVNLMDGLSRDAPDLKLSVTRMDLVKCDFCNLWWHLDCLDPPLCHLPSEIATGGAGDVLNQELVSSMYANWVAQNENRKSTKASADWPPVPPLQSDSSAKAGASSSLKFGNGFVEVVNARQVQEMRLRCWGSRSVTATQYGALFALPADPLNGIEPANGYGSSSNQLGFVYIRRRWMCPCHADWVTPKKRLLRPPRPLSSVPAASTPTAQASPPRSSTPKAKLKAKASPNHTGSPSWPDVPTGSPLLPPAPIVQMPAAGTLKPQTTPMSARNDGYIEVIPSSPVSATSATQTSALASVLAATNTVTTAATRESDTTVAAYIDIPPPGAVIRRKSTLSSAFVRRACAESLKLARSGQSHHLPIDIAICGVRYRLPPRSIKIAVGIPDVVESTGGGGSGGGGSTGSSTGPSEKGVAGESGSGSGSESGGASRSGVSSRRDGDSGVVVVCETKPPEADADASAPAAAAALSARDLSISVSVPVLEAQRSAPMKSAVDGRGSLLGAQLPPPQPAPQPASAGTL